MSDEIVLTIDGREARVAPGTSLMQGARRTLLEMLNPSVDLTEAPELQEQMRTANADPQRFPGAERRTPPLIDDNPMYVRDYAKCILCWRCVQVCAADAQYTFAI